jgi:hypothetical protein
VESYEGGADGEAREAGFCDGGVDDALFAEAVEEAFCYFVAVWALLA